MVLPPLPVAAVSLWVWLYSAELQPRASAERFLVASAGGAASLSSRAAAGWSSLHVDGMLEAPQLASVVTETWQHVHLEVDGAATILTLTLMAAAGGGAGHLRGLLGEVAVWRESPPAAMRLALVDGFDWLEPHLGLSAYYGLEEDGAVQVPDYTREQPPATLVGEPRWVRSVPARGGFRGVQLVPSPPSPPRPTPSPSPPR